ncbi:hypothetical protein [Candidatus Pantoea persica]|uniref:hypothetical protein n=1 Tax=Candidatus Pantoea persica TaxID=2518128 RepID=UPI00215D6548|nr:hypothetical protein [Candidatus Pantoea persica]MBA2814273.1 hypothetical protein [Candidatus Pantoea persica]
MLVILLMTGFIWMPWLMLTLVPLPGMTRRMEMQLASFNRMLQAETGADRDKKPVSPMITCFTSGIADARYDTYLSKGVMPSLFAIDTRIAAYVSNLYLYPT